MAGVMPPTGLLLINGAGMVVGEFDNWVEIAGYFGGLGFDKEVGRVTLGGIRKLPAYVTIEDDERNGWTAEEACRDWAKCYLPKNIPRGCKVYRFVR